MKKPKNLLPSKIDVCPYINDTDCARPNKDPMKFCALYKHCTSYNLLEACKKYREEKENGKADTQQGT